MTNNLQFAEVLMNNSLSFQGGKISRGAFSQLKTALPLDFYWN